MDRAPRTALPVPDGAAAPARVRERRWIGPVLRLAVSLALVAFVCRRIDTAGLARQFVAESPAWLVAAGVATLAQIAIAALRWRQILQGLEIPVSVGDALDLSYIASFFNSWLLGTMGGDVARAVLAPAGDRGRETVVHSVLLDRVVSFAGLGLAILPLAVLNVGPLARSLPLIVSLAIAIAPIVLMPALTPLAILFSGRRLPFSGLVLGLGQSWQRLSRAGRRLAAALVIAVAGALALSITAWFLARAENLDVSLAEFLVLMPPVMLLAGLPISIGGWGVREGAMIAALATVGVGAGAATLLSLQLGGLAAVLSLPAGVLWLWRQMASARARSLANVTTRQASS